MLEKSHKLLSKTMTTDVWKVAFTDHLKRAAIKTYQESGGEVHQALDCLHGCGCHWWSLRASAVTPSISEVRILILSPTNQLFSEPQ